jgi:hypothetical protein
VTEILDRLTSIAVVRTKLDETTDRIETMGAWLLDHEKRMVRLEARADLPSGATGKAKRLPKKK